MTMPSDAEKGEPSVFDKFATKVGNFIAKAPFFAFCVFIVLIWFPTLFFMPIDSSQLIINTTTTIITFLMVAVLENVTKRGNDALQHKLNAIAEALAVVMDDQDNELEADELRKAVGLEDKESS
jgi:low affinity Fe/Cu permease